MRTPKHSNRNSKGFNQSPTHQWSLIGIPDHQGVMNVGGRVGAAEGPAAFRKIFAKFKGITPVLQSMKDHGDVEGFTSDVESNHRLASAAVTKAHGVTTKAHESKANAGVSVAVGGGHDHGFSHLAGILEALRARKPKARLGCINIDAHLDVRVSKPIITSGSPFYLAIENGVLPPASFIEFGIQSHCNGPELWKYISDKKVSVIPFENVRHGKAPAAFKLALKKLRTRCDAIVVSLDLDAAAATFAPGVSAPQAEGFSASEIIEMMEIAGADSKVASLGIFELNPAHDIHDMTARLGATAAYHFVERALRRF